jgi:ubiquinone/menaquinone biosynthesis C-methylase UbiE
MNIDATAPAQSLEDTAFVRFWNDVLAPKFIRFKHILVDGLSQHSEAIFPSLPVRKGDRVLDVGCGFGDTTRRIAAHVTPGGEAVGVDCAPGFIDIAAREAREASIKNASFLVADAQSDDLGGPYDYVFSRFGTMFFNLPGRAMRNIRRALVPGGELAMVVWRRREDNLWLYEAEQRVKQIVPIVSHEDTDQVHCGPGPFSMAGADTVSDLLRDAGYDRITLARFDADICIGRTLDDAVAFALEIGPAGEIIRLAGDIGEKCRGRAIAALRETFASYQRADGIWAPSSTWLVTARNADVNPARD